LTWFEAIVLGIIQGATEFLPISSSGHLVLVPWLLHWQPAGQSNLAFDTLLHLGTLVAVVGYFRRDLIRIVRAVVDGIRDRRLLATPEARLGWFILAGSIPAALVGFLLEDWFDRVFGNPIAAACALFVTAALLFVAERIGRRQRALATMSWWDAMWIGCAQALAIFPGISRSGATISTGLGRGLERSDATRYSFMLGVPAVSGAGAWQLVKLLMADAAGIAPGILAAGFVSAALIGFLAIHALLVFIRRRRLYLFSIYCVLLGTISLLAYVVRS
jgi:undecaprenyl-diphosphatase